MPRVPIQQLPEEEDDWEDDLIEEYTEKSRKKIVNKKPKNSDWDDREFAGSKKRSKNTTN